MKHSNHFFSYILLLLFVNNQAFAQKSPCEVALIQGGIENFESKYNFSYNEAVSELFEHDYLFWSNYQRSSSKSDKGDAAYKIFSARFGSSSDKSSAETKFNSFKETYEKNRELSTEQQVYISQKTASEIAYNAWTKCMSDNHEPLKLVKEGSGNDEFIVSAQLIPRSGGLDSTKITNIALLNCSFVSGDLLKGASIKPFNTLLATFKRTNREEDVTITISFQNFGNKTIEIPKFSSIDQQKSQPIPPPSLPAGTVVAYAGARIPNGWLLCDGSNKNEKEYPVLYNAIGTIWGEGDLSEGGFNLPDMRGLFLRGVDLDANNDPDKLSRTAIRSGAKSGNTVGSLQMDELKGHRHNIRRDNNSGNQKYGIESPSKGYGSDEMAITEEYGGSETRPKNVAVYYIIKY